MRRGKDIIDESTGQHENIYELRPIDPNTEIRLVRILPKKIWSDTIRCEVITCRPTEEEYIAISYTWGDTELVETIICSDLPVRVTANCHDVLLTLQDNAESSPVWVDALCINQADISERSAQVSRMSDIFYSAKIVVGYPGRSFLSQIKDTGSSVEAPSSKESWKLFVPKVAETPEQIASIMALHPEAFSKLFNSPWFLRTWVVQEVMLPRRLYVFLGPKIRVNFESIWPSSYSFSIWPLIFEMRQNFHLEYSDPIGRKGYMNLNYWRLFELMESTNHVGCHDSRDKLFAILPLFLRPIPEILRPDYSKTVVHVYADLSWFLINYDVPESLSFAGICQAGLDCPSWITNWTAKRTAVPLRSGAFVDQTEEW